MSGNSSLKSIGYPSGKFEGVSIHSYAQKPEVMLSPKKEVYKQSIHSKKSQQKNFML